MSLEQMSEIMRNGGNGVSRRELLLRHRETLAERMRELQESVQVIEHILGCPQEDFMRCAEFRILLGDDTEVPLSPSVD
ncbi:hypothetical protein [Sinosporangium siamense]|nr:hypothetical protein [Sinosporangium siamense]